MNKYFQYSLVILLIVLIASCKSISKYTIDEKPVIKMDSSLLGIWKAVEDTDKANYILVQSSYDDWQHTDRWFHLDTSEQRKRMNEMYIKNGMPIDTAGENFLIHTNTKEDTIRHAKYYRDFVEKEDYYYYITYFNRHGYNPLYQQWGSFMSIVDKISILNVPYNYTPFVNDSFLTGQSEEGYFLVRFININAAHDTITTAIVADTTLKYLANSREVRKRIEKNINNPSFYSDTLHFYKVNGYHLELGMSVDKAN